MLKLDMKHPVFKEPAGFGKCSNLCAVGKISKAMFDDPYVLWYSSYGHCNDSRFREEAAGLLSVRACWEVWSLNDGLVEGLETRSLENHQKAIDLAVKYLKESGKVEVINEN